MPLLTQIIFIMLVRGTTFETIIIWLAINTVGASCYVGLYPLSVPHVGVAKKIFVQSSISASVGGQSESGSRLADGIFSNVGSSVAVDLFYEGGVRVSPEVSVDAVVVGRGEVGETVGGA